MKIEGNQKELDAMVEFHKGNNKGKLTCDKSSVFKGLQ